MNDCLLDCYQVHIVNKFYYCIHDYHNPDVYHTEVHIIDGVIAYPLPRSMHLVFLIISRPSYTYC